MLMSIHACTVSLWVCLSAAAPSVQQPSPHTVPISNVTTDHLSAQRHHKPQGTFRVTKQLLDITSKTRLVTASLNTFLVTTTFLSCQKPERTTSRQKHEHSRKEKRRLHRKAS